MKVLGRNNLSKLLQKLSKSGNTILDPKLGGGAIIYDEISGIEDFPAGWTDEQDAGKYRLKQRKDNSLFGYVIGPHSWKKFLFTPHLKLMEARVAVSGEAANAINNIVK